MSRGREFESQHGILDGEFITFICCDQMLGKSSQIFH